MKVGQGAMKRSAPRQWPAEIKFEIRLDQSRIVANPYLGTGSRSDRNPCRDLVRKPAPSSRTTAGMRPSTHSRKARTILSTATTWRRLPGAVRFLTSSETSDGHSLDEGVVKRVTGQSPVTARHIRSKPITFLPEFKLWFQSNYEPVIKGQDLGIWRRVKKIPWNYIVPAAEKDERLPSKLRAEAPGILNWALRGLAVYVEEGKLINPAKIEAATKKYREEMDIFGRLERDCLTFANPTAEAFGSSMYSTYTT